MQKETIWKSDVDILAKSVNFAIPVLWITMLFHLF